MALNPARKGNMGRINSSQPLAVYDQLIAQPWLKGVIEQIRGKKPIAGVNAQDAQDASKASDEKYEKALAKAREELKKQLPFRAIHYSCFINNVDMSSPISVASALQNTLITNNYTGTDILVNRLRELEFAEKTGKPITSMTKEQKETQVDISSYLVPAAVESVENKIKQLNRDLNSKISPASYEETLNGLTSIFKFFSQSLCAIIVSFY